MKNILKIFYTIIFITCANLATARELPQLADSPLVKVENALKLALAEKNIEGKLKININGYERGFNLKNDVESYQVFVNDINLNDKIRRFNASVAFINHDNKTEKFMINGSYDMLINIPVLAQKMPNNAVIKDADIAWLEMPKDQVTFDTVTQPEKLIGQALKRSMPGNTILKERDLQKAQILSRNTSVDIIYNTPTLSLKTIGIALDNGGEGDIVRVRNTTSNKIIQAIVQDGTTVSALQSNNSQAKKTASIEENNYVR